VQQVELLLLGQQRGVEGLLQREEGGLHQPDVAQGVGAHSALEEDQQTGGAVGHCEGVLTLGRGGLVCTVGGHVVLELVHEAALAVAAAAADGGPAEGGYFDIAGGWLLEVPVVQNLDASHSSLECQREGA